MHRSSRRAGRRETGRRERLDHILIVIINSINSNTSTSTSTSTSASTSGVQGYGV